MLLHRHPLRLFRMQRRQTDPVPLRGVDSQLAEELRTTLLAAGEHELAGAISSLTVAEPCRCDDPSCASFYAVDRFRAGWYWRRRGRTIHLRSGLSIDAVDGRIIAVEVHDRPRLRRALGQLADGGGEL
jgi:hypothetical protein